MTPSQGLTAMNWSPFYSSTVNKSSRSVASICAALLFSPSSTPSFISSDLADRENRFGFV